MPTEISDWNDLDNVRNDLSGDYVLVNDLDSETDGYVGVGDDFEPIGYIDGEGRTSEFAGTFDGDGFAIKDLIVDFGGTTASDVGLFASTDNGSLIENVAVSGSVTGGNGDDDNGAYAGGLVGSQSGGTIQNCSSHVDVTADGNFVGSLVADNNDGTITDSYATGSAEGVNQVGGLVGSVRSEVIDSYATGSVEGDNEVGGLSGNQPDGTLETSYAVGSVTGNSDVGGLVGNVSFGEVIDCYWDTESTGQSTSDDGTGLTTSEMQGSEAETNMEGFDFENTWETVSESDTDAISDGYPILLSVDRENQLNAQGILFTFDLSVQTNPATDIGNFGATLNAELVELDAEAEDADVFFEFGETVGENQTAAQVLTTADTFDEVVEAASDQNIEFRAVAEAENGGGETFVDEGDTLTFATTPATIDGKLTLTASPAVDATLLAENKTQEIRYGSTTTNDLGEYAIGDISGLEIGDMIELLIDVKRDGKSNVTRSLYPTVGGE